MTTYNGSKFLERQLESILFQTHPVDEVIICDDGSTDDTENIILSFIANNSLSEKWKFERNTTNKGADKNFINAAEKCTGDIVFFSDQDDIWAKNKIEEMVSVFFNHSDAMVVSCSEIYIDSNDKKLITESKLHRDKDKSVKCEKISFEKQMSTLHSPGLTVAFRRPFVYEIAPLVFREGVTYDTTMGLLSSIRGSFYRLYMPLVFRRIHETNFTRPDLSLSSRVRNYDHHIGGRYQQLLHMETIQKYYENELCEKDRVNLEKRINDTKLTITYLESMNVMGLLKLCFSTNPMNNVKLNIGNAAIAFLRKVKYSRKDRN